MKNVFNKSALLKKELEENLGCLLPDDAEVLEIPKNRKLTNDIKIKNPLKIDPSTEPF